MRAAGTTTFWIANKNIMLYLKKIVWFSLVTLFISIIFISCGDDEGPSASTGTPEITGVNPDSGFVGDQVTISANGLVPQAEENIVRFNGTRAEVKSVSPGQLVTAVPESASTGQITLEVVGGISRGPSFTVLTPAPVINTVAPMSGAPGTRVTITGQYFTTAALAAAVADIRSRLAITSGFTAENTAEQPALRAETNNDKPSTSGNHPEAASPPQPALPDTTETQQAGRITISFGGAEAPIIKRSATQIVAEIPPNAKDGPIKITVDGQTVIFPGFDVILPDITTIDPASGMPGTIVKITGENFDLDDIIGVAFNGTEALITSSSATEITTTVPDEATSGPVLVTVGELSVTGPDFNVQQNQPPTIIGNTSFRVDENQTTVDIITAEDPEGKTFTFSIAGGADQALFSIGERSGALSFNSAPDFENPADADNDNIYNVRIAVSDGSESVSQLISITVTDVDENQAPAITSNSSFDIAENTTAVGTISASDPNGDNLTFSLSGGTDQGVFSIDGNSGALEFDTAPDFENPGDDDANNVYEIEVSVTDGTETASQSLSITVTDVNENQAPAITSNSSFDVAENTTAVGTISASDPNGDALTFSITGGDDQNLFSIDQNSGALVFNSAPDFEAPADANADNIYLLEVTAGDGSQTASQPLTITVTDVNENEAPSITSGATFSVDENSTAAGTVTASDPNGDALTFSLSGGADQGQFSIDGSSGALEFTTAPDFENPTDADTNNDYEVQVSVTDGTESVNQNLTITVTDVAENQPPSITSGAAFNLAENSTAVGAVTASDPEGDALTFSLSGGADQRQFSLDGSSGALTFDTAPDFESPSDANTDNTYELQVQVSDGSESATQNLTINLINRNDNTPVITSGAAITATEGQTAAGTITATDADGDALTFTISGGADAGDFGIGSVSGALTFNAAPDFANPTDANTDNEYLLTVQVSDGSNTAMQNLTVTVPSPFAGGDGTAGDPYRVASLTQLQRVGDFLDAHFEQTAHIDASATANASYGDGKGFAPIGDNSNQFTGTYDGAGLTISGLTIDRASTNRVGLFGDTVAGSELTDIVLTGLDITGGGSTGGLVGRSLGSITGSHATGTVNGTDNTGGLVGLNNTSDPITRSYATGVVNGNSQVGGLVGDLVKGDIRRSYATGNVTGTGDRIGGLVGKNEGFIADTYATGTVNGNSVVGGLVGINSFGNIRRSFAVGAVSGTIPGGLTLGADPADVTDSYWDTVTTGQATSVGGTGLTTAQMQGGATPTNMTGFDFTGVWETQTGDYPILRGVGGQ